MWHEELPKESLTVDEIAEYLKCSANRISGWGRLSVQQHYLDGAVVERVRRLLKSEGKWRNWVKAHGFNNETLRRKHKLHEFYRDNPAMLDQYETLDSALRDKEFFLKRGKKLNKREKAKTLAKVKADIDAGRQKVEAQPHPAKLSEADILDGLAFVTKFLGELQSELPRRVKERPDFLDDCGPATRLIADTAHELVEQLLGAVAQ